MSDLLKKCFFIFLCLAVFSAAGASTISDTGRIQLAHAEAPICTEIYKANVVFPSIFSGQEERMKTYILNFSKNRRDYVIRMHQKSRRYFSKVSNIFNTYGVPAEFRVLMALESAFNAKAVSKAGAVGFWQFMDQPAKEYGLKIIEGQLPGKSTSTVKKQTPVKGKSVLPTDDRTHFTKSTYAAAKYLRDRSRNLNNNWLLIAASYNWGIGNVWAAMKKTKLEQPDYWDIEPYVPAETRAYVLNFITLNVLFHNYDAFLKNDLRFEDREVKQLLLPVINPTAQTL
ncbi:MAG TPA: lytic transglycosylase domain-containing protein [Ferruginibacter sp.]|nr:lytic transglycosylase domain-containing protein [Ferruginibacter sp.]HRO16775.1 lytic transglycosylase domain-containing protein [Ferruginibacter sp.]HRQ20311.1 lytic transglycosylase domain-containing protein [Ferruginibacter sp.]